MPTPEALAQSRWGVTDSEIPMLPQTARGVLFDTSAEHARKIAADFLKIRNLPDGAVNIIASVKTDIESETG